MRKENRTLKQILAKLLVFALVFQLAVPVGAAPVVEEISVAEAVEEMVQEEVVEEAALSNMVTEEDVLPETAEGDFTITKGVLTKYTGTDVNVEVPNTVTVIGSNAFDGCDTVKTIKLPDTVTEIKSKAFINCPNLEELTLPNVEKLSGTDYVFSSYTEGATLVDIIVPEKLTNFDSRMFSNKYDDIPLSNYKVDPNNTKYYSDSYGMLYQIVPDYKNGESALILLEVAGGIIDYYEMPGNLVNTWMNHSIYNIKNVELNGMEDLWKLGAGVVFWDVEKVIISKDLQYWIPASLYSVFPETLVWEVEEGNEYFAEEDGVIFSKDGKTLYYYPRLKDDLEHYVIPDTVEQIVHYAFIRDDNLKITLSKNLKWVDSSAFWNYGGGAMTIYTNGSKPESLIQAYRDIGGVYITRTEDGESETVWLDYIREYRDTGDSVNGWLYGDLVSVSAPNYTDSAKVKLTGWGVSETTEDVVIECNGAALATVKADKKDRWNTTVTLPITADTPDGAEFVLVAKMGEAVSKEVTVVYKKMTFPKVVSADCYHYSKYPVDMEKCATNAIIFASNVPTFQANLKLEDTDRVESATCYVFADKHYPLVKDEESGEWIIQIPVNSDGTYLPNKLKIECVLKADDGSTFTYEMFNFYVPWIIDPSGYIYEAVPENRVEGARMTIYYKASEEADDETAEKWEAEPYYQSNPIMTNAEGRYAWDVPEGWWQVVAEKDGYEVTKSDWLEVPPPQLDVNLELVSTEKPGVASVELSSDKMKVVFDKYVKTASVADKISLSAGEAVAITEVKALNSATRGEDAIATTFEVAFESALDASKTYTAAFAAGIESYASIAMDATEVADLKVAGIVTGLEVQESMLLKEGKEYTYEVVVGADQNLEGRKVSVVSSDESVVNVTESVMTDKDGKASVVVKGYKAGAVQLTFTVNGTTVSKTVNATVVCDSSVMDELQESLEVEIPEGSDITTDEPGETPSVSDNDIPKDPTEPEKPEKKDPIDLAKATVATIANQVYTGSALTPAVTVTVDGKTLVKDTDYTVAYANNTDAGTAQVTITGKGNYTGTKTVTFTIDKAASKLKASKSTYKKAYGAKAFTVKVTGAEGTVSYKSSSTKVAKVSSKGKVTIKNTGRAVITASVKESKNYKAGSVKIVIEVSPKKAAIKTLASKKAKELTVTWKKDTKATGYEISYSTSKKFKKSQTKKVLVKKNKTTKTTIKKLKKGKTYYVKVRAYKEVKVNGKKVKIYSPYSKVLKKKVK